MENLYFKIANVAMTKTDKENVSIEELKLFALMSIAADIGTMKEILKEYYEEEQDEIN